MEVRYTSPTELNNFAGVRICRPTQKPIMLNRKFLGNVIQIFSRRLLFFYSRCPFCAGHTPGIDEIIDARRMPSRTPKFPLYYFPTWSCMSILIYSCYIIHARRRPFFQFPPIWRSDTFAFCTNNRVV